MDKKALLLIIIVLTGCTENCKLSVQPVLLEKVETINPTIDGLMLKETCEV